MNFTTVIKCYFVFISGYYYEPRFKPECAYDYVLLCRVGRKLIGTFHSRRVNTSLAITRSFVTNVIVKRIKTYYFREIIFFVLTLVE